MIEINEMMSKLLSHYAYSTNLNFSEYGVWQIFGDDEMRDFTNDQNPSLGYAEGTFLDVLAYASTLPDFNNFAGGGYIKKHNPNIVPVKKGFYSDLNNGVFEKEQTKLKKEKEELERRLEELNTKIVK